MGKRGRNDGSINHVVTSKKNAHRGDGAQITLLSMLMAYDKEFFGFGVDVWGVVGNDETSVLPAREVGKMEEVFVCADSEDPANLVGVIRSIINNTSYVRLVIVGERVARIVGFMCVLATYANNGVVPPLNENLRKYPQFDFDEIHAQYCRFMAPAEVHSLFLVFD